MKGVLCIHTENSLYGWEPDIESKIIYSYSQDFYGIDLIRDVCKGYIDEQKMNTVATAIDSCTNIAVHGNL